MITTIAWTAVAVGGALLLASIYAFVKSQIVQETAERAQWLDVSLALSVLGGLLLWIPMVLKFAGVMR